MTTPEQLDQFARDYYLNPDVADIEIENAAQRASVKHIVPHLVGCESILHMGWGTGVLVRALAEYGYGDRAEVIEGSPVLAKEAMDSGAVSVLHNYMFEDFPVGPMPYHYDAVIASHVLEHLEDPVGVLKRVHSWLKPSGKVIVIVPNAESLHRRIAVQMGLIPDVYTLSERDHEVGHVQLYDHARLYDEVCGSGFLGVQAFGYQLKPLHNAALKDMPAAYRDALNQIRADHGLMANIGLVAVKR